ncbi:myb/sant-like dna-binding domain [Holotrichia oblita]|uniref:Myb/sant-like dna-binding domain n=1 Tax=Holotrichia oblita TaxID=644536 RepID=A0ACB9SNY5_HOLOL|nr:myb/sant-like dna-binding domain [Holotrichia oblita]
MNASTSNIPQSNITTKGQGRWSHEAILMLIDQYQKQEGMFKSNTVRNDTVWQTIANKLCDAGFQFSWTQCENKFKNLKRRYQKKVDNMKSTSTGAETIKFDYFNRFDEIFGEKPNIRPLSIASSSRVIHIEVSKDVLSENDQENEAANVNEDEVVDVNANKVVEMASCTRKTKADKFMEQIKKIEKEKEESKQRRHEELLETQCKIMKMFEDKMDKLIEKL